MSETPPSKRLRRKNAIVSSPNIPQPIDDNHEAKSSLAEESSYEAQGLKEDATPIERQDPPFILAHALVPIVE